YAPAVNIHRSPFSGRNFEYYSEDGFHAGMMSAYVIRGAQNKGLFCYVKHFGVNDQESNRCGLLTWCSEQSMREIYIRPFELDVKVGKTRAMMSSLNRIGYEPAGCCYGLLTEILRDEWGFRGNVVTDSWSTGWHDCLDSMIRAGGNLALGGGSLKYSATASTVSATTLTALRNAAKGILYAHANSLAMNTGSTPVVPKPIESYVSTTLTAAVLDGTYSANVANAVISKVLFPNADDSEIVYTIAEGSRLPNGLTLSTEGKITGSPKEEVNNFRFTVNATYADYTRSADFTITVINANGSIIYEAETLLGNVTIGKPCDINIATATIVKPDAEPDEVFPTITYKLAPGSLLPDGLTLTADGKITGTTNKEIKDYAFTVIASALGYKDVSVTFTLGAYNEVTFEGGALPTGKWGVNYVQRITFAQTDSEHPVSYSLKSGSILPEGLAFTSGGFIIGTPTEACTAHKFTVLATSDYAETKEAEFEISIGLAFNSVELAYGTQNVVYASSVNTAQGVAGITYALKDGSKLPEGLTLAADGSITGTPKLAGSFVFTVTASADGYVGDEQVVTLFVANGVPADVYVPNVQTVGGCGGVIGAGSAVVAAVALLGGACLVTRKKKEED
ncbi:MAG: hypothetical protein NC184_07925, partial [Roseburia sp.]|nr:hypothetical protein [Roseburia sp.]